MSEQLQRRLHPDADLLSAFAEGVLPEHERMRCVEHLAECTRCREIVFQAQGPGAEVHPDAETLSAFAEGALPEAEQAQCIAHLAECARCREIVFLAHPEKPASAVVIPIRRPWFVRASVWSAAAVAALVVLGVWLAPREQKKATEPSAAIHQPAQVEQPERPAAAREPAVPKTARTYTPAPVAPAPEIAGLPEAAPLAPQAPVQPPAVVARVEITEYPEAAPQGSRLTGAVTDASGAFVPGAAVSLAQRDGQTRANARTDASGRFVLDGLPHGVYDLRIEMPGFKTSSQVVDLRAAELAVAPRLDVGSVTETVDVTAATPMLQAESSQVVTRGPRPLPSKLPVQMTAISGKVTLAVDSAGTLFRSTNAGRKWKKVKPRWSGKVDNIEPRESPISAFELTTESGSVWLSRDGEHWFPAPAEP
ncbi:MAG: carboxypeptidase regulatory-like domain-containing protein [Bryobacterales bacterium]|nr:carboxypeptidase regulatory-like domain-containing protein [Bryobacterales bacterium]